MCIRVNSKTLCVSEPSKFGAVVRRQIEGASSVKDPLQVSITRDTVTVKLLDVDERSLRAFVALDRQDLTSIEAFGHTFVTIETALIGRRYFPEDSPRQGSGGIDDGGKTPDPDAHFPISEMCPPEGSGVRAAGFHLHRIHIGSVGKIQPGCHPIRVPFP